MIRLLQGVRRDDIARIGLVQSEPSVVMNTRYSGGWEQLSLAQRWKRLAPMNLAAAVIAVLAVVAWYRLRAPSQIVRVLICTIVYANVMGGLIAAALIRFGRRMYFRPFPQNWLLIAGAILASVVTGNLATSLAFLAFDYLPETGFWRCFWDVNQFAALIALVFGISAFLYEIVCTSLEVATLELRNRQLNEERSRKLALEAQLASLESQIRPHFLFNALNTISSSIHDDPKLAESLLGRLAALLRSSLDANQRRLAPLAAELKIVKDYLEIERARFGDRLRYEIDAPPETQSAEVPALSLQTLVENSVKYAVAPRAEGGAIRIVARAGNGEVQVEVSDDGPGFTKEDIRPGHGLDNLQSRMTALFGAGARLEIERNAGRTAVRLRVSYTQDQPAK
jgi:two-component system, LytTR family, sensor histidine kinase AlgZ